MVPRDPSEQHRAASSLELFFDLVFVVAVSFSAVQLHHMVVEGHLASGVLGYMMVFFAIWWSWVNFSWFATSFDNDDWLYRVLTLIQMAGVLVLAAGVAEAIEHRDSAVITLGYVIMRLAMVSQWIRAGLSNPGIRATAQRYALGITLVQLAWIARLFLPEQAGFIAFFVLVIAEISVPIWPESRLSTPWNPGHITERYGLFTLILLGESILASANAVVKGLDIVENVNDLLVISAAALVTAAGMWWTYFSREHHRYIGSLRSSLAYGYFHYFIFAAAGAFSVGVEMAIDAAIGGSGISGVTGAAILSLPVSLFLLGIWALTLRYQLARIQSFCFFAGIIIVLAGTVLPGTGPVLAVAAGVVLCAAATGRREPLPA